jgi:hypothetical protein
LANLRLLFYDLIWYRGFGWLIGYGYRPWNALFISFGFIWLGAMIFRFAKKQNILKQKGEDAETSERIFSAFIYSLETFVPSVKLGVADGWKIDGEVRRSVKMGSVLVGEPGRVVLVYYWIHTMAGFGRLGVYVSVGRRVHWDFEALTEYMVLDGFWIIPVPQRIGVDGVRWCDGYSETK